MTGWPPERPTRPPRPPGHRCLLTPDGVGLESSAFPHHALPTIAGKAYVQNVVRSRGSLFTPQGEQRTPTAPDDAAPPRGGYSTTSLTKNRGAANDNDNPTRAYRSLNHSNGNPRIMIAAKAVTHTKEVINGILE